MAGLRLEELNVRYFLLNFQSLLCRFVKHDSTTVDIMDLNLTSLESHEQVVLWWVQAHELDLVPVAESYKVSSRRLLLLRNFKRVRFDTPAWLQVPATDKAVHIDSENLLCLVVEETTGEFCPFRG